MKNEYGVIFIGPFPKGNVSTMRVLSYCRSLVKLGKKVTVYIIAPTREASINKNRIGSFEGIKFEYVTKITWKKNNPNIIIKLLYYAIGLFKTCGRIYNSNIGFIISYHDNPVANFIFGLFSRINNISIVLDRTEYPKNWGSLSLIRKKIISRGLQMYNGIITITNELVAFYSQVLKNQDKIYLLPVTISSNRYDNVIYEQNKENYIAVVFGTHNRDSLIDSVKSYIKYYEDFGDSAYRLFIVGDFNQLLLQHPENKVITKLILDNNLNEKIKIIGKVSNDEIPNLLANAKCLLTTPRSFISGGFPTKLGEYLLSGNPVITTSAGEIDVYLKDKESAFLASPGDIDKISCNLKFVHLNDIYSKEVGQVGRNLALKAFNPDTYIHDMIKFIESVRSI